MPTHRDLSSKSLLELIAYLEADPAMRDSFSSWLAELNAEWRSRQLWPKRVQQPVPSTEEGM